jgi:hypothetical protein
MAYCHWDYLFQQENKITVTVLAMKNNFPRD